jgi:hypothetical protein
LIADAQSTTKEIRQQDDVHPAKEKKLKLICPSKTASNIFTNARQTLTSTDALHKGKTKYPAVGMLT